MLTASVNRRRLSASFDRHRTAVRLLFLPWWVHVLMWLLGQPEYRHYANLGTAVIDLQMRKLVITCFSAGLMCDSALLCSDDEACFHAGGLTVLTSRMLSLIIPATSSLICCAS